jgi:hypothetical protein
LSTLKQSFGALKKEKLYIEVNHPNKKNTKQMTLNSLAIF